MANTGNEVQLKFKCDSTYIEILKGGKLTRSDIQMLIKEAQVKNKIVNLSNKDLSGLNLSKLSLGRSNMSGSNLSNSNLSESTFFNANLSNCNLTDANLTYTDFSYASLLKAKIGGSQMSNAIMLKTVLP